MGTYFKSVIWCSILYIGFLIGLLSFVWCDTEVEKHDLKLIASLLQAEGNIQSSACDGLIQMEKDINKDEITEINQDKKKRALKDQLLSAKIIVCEVHEKTKFLIKKIEALEKTSMPHNCFQRHQCKDILPAIDSLESHLTQRQEKFDAAVLTISMINETLPVLSEQKMQKKIEMAMSRINDIIMNAIFNRIPNDCSDLKKYVSPLLMGTFIAILVLTKLLRHFVLCLLIFVVLGFYLFFQHSSSYELVSLVNTFEKKILPLQNSKNQAQSALNKMFHEAKMKRNIEDFKNVVKDNIRYNGEKVKADFTAITEIFNEHSLITALKSKGFGELSLNEEMIMKDFKRYLEELIKTLRFSQEFYQYAVNSFQAIIESRESIKKWELLLFLENIINKSVWLEEEFSAYKVKFLALVNDLNNLFPEIKKHLSYNNNMDLGTKAFGATVAAGVAILFPPLAAALFIPGIGAGVLYRNSVHKENDVLLQNLAKSNKRLNDYARNTADHLRHIDPKKITEAIKALKSGVKDEVSHDALVYYFQEVLEMAQDNLKEVNDLIKNLKNLYAKS